MASRDARHFPRFYLLPFRTSNLVGRARARVYAEENLPSFQNQLQRRSLRGELNPLDIRLLFFREIDGAQVRVRRGSAQRNAGKADVGAKGKTRRIHLSTEQNSLRIIE